MTRTASSTLDDLPLSYAESKALASDTDARVRARLAGREDVRPEVLYFLAEDSSAEVRRQIAANHKTPRQADALLSHDADASVRRHLAEKIAVLLPDLDPSAQAQAQSYLLEAIETLAQDQVTKIRQVVAETLKDLAIAPAHVIQRLARDSEDVVASPVLEFSPLLSDADLIEIIEGGCATGKLQAVSRRNGVGERVTDAIVATNDVPAIADLLANGGAQIREETLDRLVDAAVDATAWQAPLVARPKLSPSAVQKLARFVTESLLDVLQRRDDLDRKAAKAVAKEVRRRVKAQQKTARRGASVEPDDHAADPAAHAQRLRSRGELDDDALLRALNSGERPLVRHGLAARAEVPVVLVDHILSAHSAKGVTALAWKAGCAMRFATQLQLRLGGIPPHQALKPRGGTEYPLTDDEMRWQLEFFEGLIGWKAP